MLVAALVVVLGLLWALTSFAPKSMQENGWRVGGENQKQEVSPTDNSLSASVGNVYDGELPPPPPPAFIF